MPTKLYTETPGVTTPPLTAERAREVLEYIPETGQLFWLWRDNARRSWNTRYAGQEAFRVTDRYRQGRIDGHPYYAHRVIWLIMTGDWPEGDIEHIDRDRTNNRWKNLRDTSHAENMHNAGMFSTNTSGVKGVCWSKQREKWRARITIHGKAWSLGLYDTLADAATARRAAEEQTGFLGIGEH